MDLAGEPGGALPGHERTVIAGVLALIALLAAMDLLIDLREGVTPWHVLTEGMVAVLACLGAFHLLRGAAGAALCIRPFPAWRLAVAQAPGSAGP